MLSRILPLPLRTLGRAPGFVVAAVLTLALGIGLSTAVFTVANALLLRRLPVRDQDRLVVLWGVTRDGRFSNNPLGLDEARRFARGARSLSETAVFAYPGAGALAVQDGGSVSQLRRALVSGNYFAVLGAHALLGRGLHPTDDVFGAPPVVVLSYDDWQRRLGGDPAVIGRRLRLVANGVTYTVVGVMPQGLDYPRGTDFWAPINASVPPAQRSEVAVDVVGRLAVGAAPASARAALTAFFARAASPWQHDLRGAAHTLPAVVLGNARPAVLVFAAASGLLLLLACVNVANLLLVRGMGRTRELAVRTALGASRRALVAQLIAENMLLAVAGGLLGLGVAAVGVRSFVALAPPELPRLGEIHVDAAVLAGAAAITALAVLVFGLAPAAVTSRVEAPQQVLRSDAHQTATRRSRLVTEALVAGQIALALLVLSAAALVARSLLNLERARLSFDPSHLLIGELAIPYRQYDDVARQRALLERLVSTVRALPGVRGASPVVAVPYSGSGGWDGRPASEGQTPTEAAANPVLNMEVVTPDYFATLGIPVLRGRGFRDADRKGSPPVCVVSQSVARHYWPGSDPIGRRLYMGPHLRQSLTVVGVVPDTRYRDLREARPSIYFPLRQSFFPFTPAVLAIRTVGTPSMMVPTLRRAIAAAAPGVALASAEPFATYLEQTLAQPRLDALLLAVFASAAAALAAIGLVGVVTAMVRRRTRELGVRLALGATAANLRQMVLRRGLAIAGVGAAAGLLGAVLVNRLLGALLYDVRPTDPFTLAATAALLLAITAISMLVPALMTTRLDPVIALRSDA